MNIKNILVIGIPVAIIVVAGVALLPRTSLFSASAEEICQRFSYEFPSVEGPEDITSDTYQQSTSQEIANIVIAFDKIKHVRSYSQGDRWVTDPHPYINWEIVLLSISWLGDGGNIQPIEYQQAFAPYAGILNLSYDEFREIEYSEFSQARLCSYRELLYGQESERLRQGDFTQRFEGDMMNALTQEPLENAIIQAEKGSLDEAESIITVIDAQMSGFNIAEGQSFHQGLYDQSTLLVEEYEALITEAEATNGSLEELYRDYDMSRLRERQEESDQMNRERQQSQQDSEPGETGTLPSGNRR